MEHWKRFYLVNAAITDMEGYVIVSEPQCVPGNSTIDAMLNTDVTALLRADYGREDLMSRIFIEREITKEEYDRFKRSSRDSGASASPRAAAPTS